jgi:hypothetical protein
MPNQLGADHWRRRAAEARRLAEQMGDEDARWRMLRIASDYEKIAQNAAAVAVVERIKESL